MIKTKFIGYMFFHAEWPPKPSEIDRDIDKVAKKLRYMPKVCLLNSNMPEIVLGNTEIEVIRIGKCPKKTLWIGMNMNDYAISVLR